MSSNGKKTGKKILYGVFAIILAGEVIFAGYLMIKDKSLKERETTLQAQLEEQKATETIDTDVEETNTVEEIEEKVPITGEKNGLTDANIYVLGDSIMQGTGNLVNNEPFGIADMANNKFNATVNGDVSLGGAMLTNYGINGESLSNISSSQLEITQQLVDMRGYDEKTVVILDGGANDCNIMDLDPSLITINDPNNKGLDVCQATEYTIKRLIRMFGNDNEEQGYKVPIVFVVTDYNISGFRTDCYNAQAELLAKYADYGVICLRESEYLNGGDFTDWLHPNEVGTYRLTTLINIALINRTN